MVPYFMYFLDEEIEERRINCITSRRLMKQNPRFYLDKSHLEVSSKICVTRDDLMS